MNIGVAKAGKGGAPTKAAGRVAAADEVGAFVAVAATKVRDGGAPTDAKAAGGAAVVASAGICMAGASCAVTIAEREQPAVTEGWEGEEAGFPTTKGKATEDKGGAALTMEAWAGTKTDCCVWSAEKAGLGSRTEGAEGAKETAASGAGGGKPGEEAEATEGANGAAMVAIQEREEGRKKRVDCATDR